jgi:hypothetical protein
MLAGGYAAAVIDRLPGTGQLPVPWPWRRSSHGATPTIWRLGDVKLSGVLGIYLGWLGGRTFTAGMSGCFLLAAVVSLAMLAAGKARKTHLPFGPFMPASAIGAILAGGFMPS